MGSRVHGVFLLKTRAMTERSVRSRVFVSPFPSYEKGETWQKNQTNTPGAKLSQKFKARALTARY